MSKIEDWYPLASKDLQSSSDDELPEQPAGHLEILDTPRRLELKSPFTPSTVRAESEPVNLEDGSGLDTNLSSKGQPSRSLSQLRFDDLLEEPDLSVTAQERWQRTDAYMRDVQSAFRNRPAVRVQSNLRYMKLLLVGEPGLGKDLFIKNIFAPYCSDNDLPVNSCESETDPITFLHNSADFCTEVVVDVDDGRTKIHYMIQDTPGTHFQGADRTILKHVLRQNQEYMAKEEDPRRVVPLSNLPDPRIDVCLFFLSPHFFKPQDVTLMTKLSELVPVVPVVARADALTTGELDAYRHEIRERLQNVSLQVGRPVMHNFSAADLRAAGAVRELPPFAIITSSEVDHEVGSHWFMRTFPWGRCEVMSSNHSDLPALKALLFECCFEGLKAATEARFYSAREAHLTTRALTRALSSGELPDPAAAKAVGSGSPKSGRIPKSQAALSPFVKSTPSREFSTSKKGQTASSSWYWPVGLTVGIVTAAILLQLAALGMYTRNTNHLKTLVEAYQRDAASEKQVIAELIRSLEEVLD